MVFRLITISLLLTASAFSQSADFTGWSDWLWGAPKSAALKALQPLGVRECNRTKTECSNTPGIDVLILDKYESNKVSFKAQLLFAAKGFSKAILTAEDKRDAFDRTMADLTARYGRPGLQSEYDGDEERTYTTWVWGKAHGKISLSSDEARGTFAVVYEQRR